MRITASIIVFFFIFFANAYAFEKGQRVWIDLSAVNINDDSYGEGEVISSQGDTIEVYVRSMTTSKAFSSGVFCAAPSQQSQGWESPAVYNIVNNQIARFPKQQLLPWTEGYNRFYERQNWLHTYLKWLDRHPVIERAQLQQHQTAMQNRGYQALAEVSALMISEYDAYQSPQFQPYPKTEVINKLIPILKRLDSKLQQDTALNQAWRPKIRDHLRTDNDAYLLFMTQAIDKIILDAQKTRRLVLQKDINEDTATFDQLMNKFARTEH